jgi:hypothetical protein
MPHKAALGIPMSHKPVPITNPNAEFSASSADQPDRRIFSGRRRDEFELTKMR